MSLIVTCPGCGRKLKLAEQHAGKAARCPMCQKTFPVPVNAPTAPGGSDDVLIINDSTSSPASTATAANYSARPGPTPTESWYMRTPEGHQYGPVPKGEMDSWVKEGRVTAQCHLKNGEGPWQPAGSIYSYLGGASSGPAQPMQPARPMQPMHAPNPFSQPMHPAPYNPYSAPMAPGMPGMPYPMYGYRKPHRGGLILGLSLAGFFFCPILHVITVAMAWTDLTEMQQGTMDSSGEGLTRAGQILSSIVLALFCLALVFGIVAAAADF